MDDRCPDCFADPMTPWQRLELSFKSLGKHHRFRCTSCDSRLRVIPSASARRLGRVAPVVVFLGLIVPEFFGYPAYWGYLMIAAVGVAVIAVAFRAPLTFERDDLPESPSMDRVREMDEDGW